MVANELVKGCNIGLHAYFSVLIESVFFVFDEALRRRFGGRSSLGGDFFFRLRETWLSVEDSSSREPIVGSRSLM
jgi:hypothetical protein